MDPNGYVAPGFENVADAFASLDLGVGGAAFAAYCGGELVVDLRSGTRHGEARWDVDTLAVLMSATKGLTTACLQLLVDRGHVDVDAPVCRYWPEFAANGKEGVLVRHVLAHTSGVVHLPDYDALRWTGEGWNDSERASARLASAVPAWAPGRRHGYHALTYGWLVGELVRRVAGISLGTFFRREFAAPLCLEAWIGTPVDEHHRVARVVEAPSLELPPDVAALFEAWSDPTTLQGKAFFAGPDGNVIDRITDLMNSPLGLSAELGGSNGTATASSFARFYAVLAGNGVYAGTRYLSKDVIDAFRVEQANGPDAVGVTDFRWALGYQLPLPSAFPGVPDAMPPEAFGHGGLGGQLGFADPHREVAVGFVRSHLEAPHVSAPFLVDALYKAIG